MDLFSRVIIFICFVVVGSLAICGRASIGLPDFIFGVIFATIIVFIRPDIFKSKKKSA